MFPRLVNGRIFVPFFVGQDGMLGDGWEELSPDDPDFERMRAFLTDVQSWIFNINQYAADKLASSDEVPVANGKLIAFWGR
jgi:hypothetical protein